jgi:glycerol-3-phosphate dehydrogenase (NAD(P)+)
MTGLAIIGAGSWGTALAIVLAPRFERVSLWVYEADLAERMRLTRVNDVYLPGFQVPSHVEITSDLGKSLQDAQIVLSVVPSHLVRAVYGQMLPYLRPSMIFASATKGLENGTLLRMSELICQAAHVEAAVISGPSFAREVAELQPTAVVVAAREESIASGIQQMFSGPTLRLYTSTDPIGVEIGGSIKNVVAIGAGVLHGMGLGHNAMAALITRGLAEITRLAVAMGGKPHTLSGLAGLGDLVLTCNGDLSRNRTVGMELAKGKKLQEIVAGMKMVAEGIKTTDAAVDLARKYSVDMPIAFHMHQVLHAGLAPREAIRRLMERSLKGE